MTSYDTSSLMARGQASVTAHGTGRLFYYLVSELSEGIPEGGIAQWDRLTISNEIISDYNETYSGASPRRTAWNIVTAELPVLIPREDTDE